MRRRRVLEAAGIRVLLARVGWLPVDSVGLPYVLVIPAVGNGKQGFAMHHVSTNRSPSTWTDWPGRQASRLCSGC